MAWKDTLEHGDALGVSGSDTTKERLVQVAGVGGVAVATGSDARVDARGVAVPVVDVDVRHGLAGVDVDDLDVDGDGDADLSLGHVLADELARDVVRSLSHFGHEDTGTVAAEEGGLGDVHGEAGVVCQVGGVENRIEVTGMHLVELS